MSKTRKPSKLTEKTYQGYMRIRLKTSLPFSELVKLAEFTGDWQTQRTNITKKPRYFGVDIRLFATNGLKAYNNFHVTEKVGLSGINTAIISAVSEITEYAEQNNIIIDQDRSYIEIKHIINPNQSKSKCA